MTDPVELAGLAQVGFWTAAAVVLYTYLGYPVLIALAAWLRPAPAGPRGRSLPPLTVIVAARNEEDCIEAKLHSCLALDYPQEHLEIVVASDGSTDRTNEIVEGFANRGVRLLRLDPPRGKAGALNAAVEVAHGEVLLLTDATERLDSAAARELVAALGDPAVGAASGELHLQSGSGSTQAVGLYWRYEKLIRRAESRFDSTVGVTGGLYAVRRELFAPLDPRTILDDVAIPMGVVLAGHRVVFEPRAVAHDDLTGSTGAEYRRKRRTLAGNYQLLWLRPELLHPGRNRILWQLLSHKVGRLLVPWALLVSLLASGLLAAGGHLLFAVLFALQAGFYVLAGVGALAPRWATWARFPWTFVVLNLAAASGLVAFVTGRATARWKTAPPRGPA